MAKDKTVWQSATSETEEIVIKGLDLEDAVDAAHAESSSAPLPGAKAGCNATGDPC